MFVSNHQVNQIVAALQHVKLVTMISNSATDEVIAGPQGKLQPYFEDSDITRLHRPDYHFAQIRAAARYDHALESLNRDAERGRSDLPLIDDLYVQVNAGVSLKN